MSGSARDVNELKNLFDKGEQNVVLARYDPHAVATVFSVYFQSLPQPLFSHKFFSRLAEIEGTFRFLIIFLFFFVHDRVMNERHVYQHSGLH